MSESPPQPAVSFFALNAYFQNYLNVFAPVLQVYSQLTNFIGGGTYDFGGGTITNAHITGITSPAITTSGGGTTIITDGSPTTGYKLKTLTAGTNVAFVNTTDDITINASTGATPYVATFYTTQAYTSTNSMTVTLTLQDHIVCGTLDWILGGTITTSSGVLTCLPSSGPPPSQFLPIVPKSIPIGAISVNGAYWPAMMIVDPSGFFTIRFYDQSVIQPDGSTPNFPAGGSVVLTNFPFVYCTNT